MPLLLPEECDEEESADIPPLLRSLIFRLGADAVVDIFVADNDDDPSTFMEFISFFTPTSLRSFDGFGSFVEGMI